MILLSRLSVLLVLCLAATAAAEVEEIFSRHVRVFRPKGEFAAALIRLAPASGAGWKQVGGEKAGFRAFVPNDAGVVDAPDGNQVLAVTLASTVATPRPTLRVHRYAPEPGHPTRVDQDYADEYAAQYPETAFKGKFTVTDSGLVVKDRKTSFAMVGGSYLLGAAGAYRLQWAHLDESAQWFVTFDCSERDWPRYSDQVGRMLLSLGIERPRKK